MFCGGGGALRSDLTLGKFIVVKDAIRDEGLSYHYYAPSRIIEANQIVYHHIEFELNKRHIPHILGRVWTTDAFFRETKSIIELRKNEGALIVEMEQAGMIAVANYRGVSYGAIIYAGDDVSSDVWDSRGWQNRDDIRYHLVELCRDIVLSLNS
jgi:uridine phosphorylase